MSAHFGPAGNAEGFYNSGGKSTVQAPRYVRSLGLDSYEYQCGRGVNVSDATAEKLKAQADEHSVAISLHAPYYISLSSAEEEKRQKSIDYILQSARAVSKMGGRRIVIHSGSCSKMSREEALALATDTLRRARQALCSEGLQDIIMCPETMGKINQLGTLDEVLWLCSIDECMLPCIDFGHLNARTMGALQTAADYAAVLDAIENKLGFDRLKVFHSHFSKIAYTSGGEKNHLTFEDTVYGPDFEPLAELIYKKNISPTIICESAGTQDTDAVAMKRMYEAAAK